MPRGLRVNRMRQLQMMGEDLHVAQLFDWVCDGVQQRDDASHGDQGTETLWHASFCDLCRLVEGFTGDDLLDFGICMLMCGFIIGCMSRTWGTLCIDIGGVLFSLLCVMLGVAGQRHEVHGLLDACSKKFSFFHLWRWSCARICGTFCVLWFLATTGQVAVLHSVIDIAQFTCMVISGLLLAISLTMLGRKLVFCELILGHSLPHIFHDRDAKDALMMWIRVQALLRKTTRTIEKAFVCMEMGLLTMLSLRSLPPAKETNLMEHLVLCQVNVVVALLIIADKAYNVAKMVLKQQEFIESLVLREEDGNAEVETLVSQMRISPASSFMKTLRAWMEFHFFYIFLVFVCPPFFFIVLRENSPVE